MDVNANENEIYRSESNQNEDDAGSDRILEVMPNDSDSDIVELESDSRDDGSAISENSSTRAATRSRRHALVSLHNSTI
jgi:hypothetical protein